MYGQEVGRLHRPRSDGEDDGGRAAHVRQDHLQERGVREPGAQRRAPRQDHHCPTPDLAAQVYPETPKHLKASRDMIVMIDRCARSICASIP